MLNHNANKWVNIDECPPTYIHILPVFGKIQGKWSMDSQWNQCMISPKTKRSYA